MEPFDPLTGLFDLYQLLFELKNHDLNQFL